MEQENRGLSFILYILQNPRKNYNHVNISFVVVQSRIFIDNYEYIF